MSYKIVSQENSLEQAAVSAEELQHQTAIAKNIVQDFLYIEPYMDSFQQLKRIDFLLSLKINSIEGLKEEIQELKNYCLSVKNKQRSELIKQELFLELNEGSRQLQQLRIQNKELEQRRKELSYRMATVPASAPTLQEYLKQKKKPTSSLNTFSHINISNKLIDSRKIGSRNAISRTNGSSLSRVGLSTPKFTLQINERSAPEYMAKLERLKKISQAAKRKHLMQVKELKDKLAFLHSENQDIDAVIQRHRDQMMKLAEKVQQPKDNGTFDDYY